MFSFTRLLALSGLLIGSSSTAIAQQDPADPFSILAPQPLQLETSEDTPTQTPAVAGAHLGRSAYLALRGETGETVTQTRWRVERQTLAGEPTDTQMRNLTFGDGYVQDGSTIYDFTTGRVLTVTDEHVTNTAMAASAHRQMDVFTRFTRGGELEEIAGPGGVSFERFWIEAATGIRANPVDLVRSETEAGLIEIRRTPDGSAVYSVVPGERGDNALYDQLTRWMRHTLPIHPDAIGSAGSLGQLPDSFSFLVFSPSSPDGRRETWTLLRSNVEERAFPWPAGRVESDATGYLPANDALSTIIHKGLAATRRPETMPTTENFLFASQSLMQAGDLPGAYLTLMQGSQHEGECQPNTSSELCSAMTRIIIAGLGNQDFQTVASAVANRATDPAALIEALSGLTDRTDYAGAAANLMSAQAAARVPGTDTLPLDYFATSAQIDPAAPLLYWHAGRYAVSQNDIETAWLLFDIARALPSITSDTPQREAAALEERLRNISPRFFAAAQ
ncbi:hypothetical protein [Maricaulis sp.]|uniref:hypothetical protein n=1 Tax=unclassified Maricaulis TaxID=2632371 RepID=UPI001B1B8EE9|nr:hypothetical protein [Maricaulis sp.]MBO6796273.1 hypothetical protein [Maricaulis sp.]